MTRNGWIPAVLSFEFFSDAVTVSLKAGEGVYSNAPDISY